MVTLAFAGTASSQAALAATGVDRHQLPPESHLTLRPEPGLEELAGKIARVLLLRSSTRVEVGSAPPPGVPEAVPVGHVALLRDSDVIRLVMGAALGASLSTRVQLTADGEFDPRALALAIEALRDRAIDKRERQEQRARVAQLPAADGDNAKLIAPIGEPSPETTPAAGVEPASSEPATAPENPAGPQLSKPRMSASAAFGRRDDEGGAPRLDEPGRLRVEPALFFRVYGGGSPESKALRTGIGTGGGLCVRGHCLLLAIEYPLPIALEGGGGDVRYRYPTFSCSFYARPWTFGRFMPAASLGLLSRVGHFERDMGLTDYRQGLETDLGLRATLETGFKLFDAVDLVAEAGLDYALDRWQLGHGSSVTYRGPRATPWIQGGIRIRPY
jgi:hypothetical protein